MTSAIVEIRHERTSEGNERSICELKLSFF